MDALPELTPMADELQRLHELFLIMQENGFTERQALILLAEMITAQRPKDAAL